MNNELYHSDIYLGQDYSDGIRHWKYIKRERKNGRWVYYYSDAEYNKAKKNENKVINKYNKLEKTMKTAGSKIDKYNSKIEKNNTTINDYNRSGISKLWKRKKAKKAALSNDKLAEKAKKHQETYTDAYRKSRYKREDIESAKYETSRAKNKNQIRKRIAKEAIKVANAQSKFNAKVKKKVKKAINKLNKKKNKK